MSCATACSSSSGDSRQVRSRIATQKAAGRLSEAQAEQQTQLVEQQAQQLAAISLERIIDGRIQEDLATTEGVTVAETDVDARLLKEATTPETRHAWVIEVAPEIDADATEPTAAQIAAARTKIDTALRDVGGSKTWEDVAKTVSTDASTAAQGGDLGWIQAESSQEDEAFSDALFAAEIDTPTAVIEGEDGILRIGRVTEIDARDRRRAVHRQARQRRRRARQVPRRGPVRRDPREARGKGRRGRHEARSRSVRSARST